VGLGLGLGVGWGIGGQGHGRALHTGIVKVGRVARLQLGCAAITAARLGGRCDTLVVRGPRRYLRRGRLGGESLRRGGRLGRGSQHLGSVSRLLGLGLCLRFIRLGLGHCLSVRLSLGRCLSLGRRLRLRLRSRLRCLHFIRLGLGHCLDVRLSLGCRLSFGLRRRPRLRLRRRFRRRRRLLLGCRRCLGVGLPG
jgi:hypothetical protein